MSPKLVYYHDRRICVIGQKDGAALCSCHCGLESYRQRKMDGITAARAFVDKNFPDCLAALLFGSVARGDQRPTSDLDLIIVARVEILPYRKSFREYGWFIEAFVGSQKHNEEKISRPVRNRTPSFLTSYAEAIILRDHCNLAQTLKERAIAILARGPDALTPHEVDQYRYLITDWLDDFVDSTSYTESLFIAYDLFSKTAELLLTYNQKWVGDRRWLYRALGELDQELAAALVEGLETFYQTKNKAFLINPVQSVLDLTGGRLYEGFYQVG